MKKEPNQPFAEASGYATEAERAYAEYTAACRRGGSPMERECALLKYCEMLLRERQDSRADFRRIADLLDEYAVDYITDSDKARGATEIRYICGCQIKGKSHNAEAEGRRQ